jgi:tetratricopeptide (TPR) repeat protein
MKVNKHSKIYLWIGLALGALVFGTYISALCPTIHPRDNPDVIIAAATLGTAHSPGYPLYTLLGHLFTKIPIGSIPWRVNLMSALFSAATVFVIYLIILKITKKILPAVLGPLFLAFSFAYFQQSLYADFLSLNNLLVSLEVLALLVWQEKKEKRYLYLFALIFGLAFSHHQISFFLFPAFIYFIYKVDKRIFVSWELAKLFGLFSLGLLPYVYLPIAAHYSSYSWGDPTTLKGFLYMISRKEYGGESFSYVNFGFVRMFDWFKLAAWQEFTIFGFAVSAYGMYLFAKKDRFLFNFLILCLAFSGLAFAFFANVQNSPGEMAAMERFFIFSYLFLAIFIGIGFDRLTKYFPKSSYLLLVLPIALGIYHYGQVNQRRYYYAYDLGNNILNSVPKNAVLFGGWDVPLFDLWYLQKIEGKRPDVIIIPAGNKEAGELQDSMTKKILANFPDYALSIDELAKKYPVYSVNNSTLFWADKANNLIPEGIIYRYSTNSDWFKDFSSQPGEDNLNHLTYRNQYSINNHTEAMMAEIIDFYFQGWYTLGVVNQTKKNDEKAAICFQKAVEIEPDNIKAQVNLAGTYLNRGQYQEAINRYRQILKKHPNLPTAQNGLNIAETKLNATD